MKTMFKKYWQALLVLFVAGAIHAASNIFTDLWTINGTGTLNSTAIAWIDSSRDLSLYDGDIVLGGSGSQPSTTSGAYPGYQVPFYNASGGTLTEGDVVIASVTATSGTGYMTTTTALATTTVMGICAGSVANGAIGWMKIAGWAIAKTTGTVNVGDLLVTTNTVAGRLGRIAPAATVEEGAVVAKAAEVGTAAGDTILVLLNK